ncbi:glutaredoxin domain-containing protein [Agreia sp. COWG]|uniref:glutaredoxin domain-containing protein n=1 Tax=Agreia sp. COWG TaxID=2773266 RepID=UPI0019285071|nr:glutaredoxin domain-containing protein [Agreia sp. COWG]CAD6016155.1 NrdH-redoxin [Agreia sp. COWG]
MSVTVYTKTESFCGQCKATELALERAGITFNVVSLEAQTAEVIEDFKTRLGTAAPIVVTPDTAWSGFRPDLISSLAA